MSRRRSRKPDIIEQDFIDALERIKAGVPQHPKHREWLKKRGAVLVNISTVAREAGRARALIAGTDTHYQNVRNVILAEAGEAGVEPGNRDDVIADLRAQVAELRVELRAAREHAAYHFKLRSTAEKRGADYRSRYEKLRGKVGKAELRNTVVKIFPEDRD